MAGLFGSPSQAVLFRDPMLAVLWTSDTDHNVQNSDTGCSVQDYDTDLLFTSPTFAIIRTSLSLARAVKTSVPTGDPTAEHYTHRCENLITDITLVFLLTYLFFFYLLFPCLPLVFAFFIYYLLFILNYISPSVLNSSSTFLFKRIKVNSRPVLNSTSYTKTYE